MASGQSGNGGTDRSRMITYSASTLQSPARLELRQHAVDLVFLLKLGELVFQRVGNYFGLGLADCLATHHLLSHEIELRQGCVTAHGDLGIACPAAGARPAMSCQQQITLRLRLSQLLLELPQR